MSVTPEQDTIYRNDESNARKYTYTLWPQFHQEQGPGLWGQPVLIPGLTFCTGNWFQNKKPIFEANPQVSITSTQIHASENDLLLPPFKTRSVNHVIPCYSKFNECIIKKFLHYMQRTVYQDATDLQSSWLKHVFFSLINIIKHKSQCQQLILKFIFLRKYVVFTYTLIPLKPLKQINKISNINSLHKYDCAVLLDCAFA